MANRGVRVVADVPFGVARVLARRLSIRAIAGDRAAAGADARAIRGILLALHQAGAGQARQRISAAAVGILVAQVALDAAARGRLADVGAASAEGAAEVAAARATSIAHRPVDQAACADGRACAHRSATGDVANAGTAFDIGSADVAKLVAIGDLARLRTLVVGITHAVAALVPRRASVAGRLAGRVESGTHPRGVADAAAALSPGRAGRAIGKTRRG